MIDERLIRGLHVDATDLAGSAFESRVHEVFQTSTVAALVAGAFDGDLSFAELARHGDLGLGTLNGLDGEMIAVDGRFLRADVDGRINEIDPSALTPFAVVTSFSPTVSFELDGPLDHHAFLKEVNRHAPPGSPSCAIRADGDFELVHARSVPRQQPPYRTLAEAAADQHEFDFHEVTGTLVGFRFPDYAEGIELPGFHLHFVDAARERGGHVLSCRPRRLHVQIDHASDLHMELPPGVSLPGVAAAAADGAGLRAIEGEG
ncbi:MAG TPA: acetolactate decarboxylase [Thermoleophilaceae bacterium]|nr:acetolactate decarboxylase [Thermoleophilaceae bacterium]